MISLPITEADLGGSPQLVFSSHAEGGLYLVHIVWRRTAFSGLRDIQLNLNWTEADGSAASLVDGFSVASLPRFAYDRTITLNHPSDLEMHFVDQGGSGTFSGALEVYVARLKEEGS